MGSSIDLHIHSTASDGSDSVAALLEKIEEAGIRTFSITDHDTMDGALEMERLVPGGLRYIRGIEFTCITPCGKCHILGYGFDPGDRVFLDTLALGKQLRREKLRRRVAFLESRFGIVLTEAEAQWLYSQKSPGKPHFGQIIVDRGLAPDLKTAIRKYVNPCKLGNDRIDAATAIRAIVHAGGIPVWAHPLGGEGEKRLTEAEFQAQLDCLIDCGIRGLECHYARYGQQEVAFLVSQANAHGLLISGGSDYHGQNKPGLPLGKLNAENIDIDPDRITLPAEYPAP